MTLSIGVARRGSFHTSRASISRDTEVPLMAQQILEQIELADREIERPAATRSPPRDEVDFEIRRLQPHDVGRAGRDAAARGCAPAVPARQTASPGSRRRRDPGRARDRRRHHAPSARAPACRCRRCRSACRDLESAAARAASSRARPGRTLLPCARTNPSSPVPDGHDVVVLRLQRRGEHVRAALRSSSTTRTRMPVSTMLSVSSGRDPDFCVRVDVVSGARMRIPTALSHLNRDGWLLFATRFIRLFALRIAVGGAGALSGRRRPHRTSGRPGADADARRRHRRVAVPDHPRGSVRPAADADRRRTVDGRRRGGICLHVHVLAARPRRHRRRHQPERAGGRPVSADRTGVAVAPRHRSDAHRRVRVVHAHRRGGDGARGAHRGRADASVCSRPDGTASAATAPSS